MQRLFLLLLCVSISGKLSLYSSNDPVTQLSGSNFTDVVYQSPTAWVVEFYASWCGHCQRFAPVWVQFARDVQDWYKYVRVGAVACDEEAELCRQMRINGYPTIKMIDSGSQQSFLGHIITASRSLNILRQAITEKLNISNIYRKASSWSDLSQFSLNLPSQPVYVFLVLTNVTEQVTKEVALDLSAIQPTIVIVHVTQRHSLDLNQDRVYQFSPIMAYLDGPTGSRTDIVSCIKKHLNYSVLLQTSTPSADIMRTSTLLLSTVTSRQIRDQVHMQDLESALYYSLWKEIGGQNALTGAALTSAKRYVHLLVTVFPGNEYIMKFLKNLDSRLEGMHDAKLEGSAWVQTLNSIQTRDGYIPTRESWAGCTGSKSTYRGYPCSMWTLFHVLTVSDYLQGSNDYDARLTLRVIRDYMMFFFGCRECAQHFVTAAVMVETEVQSKRDSVLWLWRSHNKANFHLHDDKTEDPEHPKIQFPSPNLCPMCRVNEAGLFDFQGTVWNEDQVLQFLVNFYKREGILQDASSFPDSQYYNTVLPSASHCPSHVTTNWTSCSQSCGVGVSFRLSNKNVKCEMRMETSVCFLRPCDNYYVRINQQQNGGVCRYSSYRTSQPKSITLGNCHIDPLVLRYCGLCTNLCCHPAETTTVYTNMTCGQVTARIPVMTINSCTCSERCA